MNQWYYFTYKYIHLENNSKYSTGYSQYIEAYHKQFQYFVHCALAAKTAAMRSGIGLATFWHSDNGISLTETSLITAFKCSVDVGKCDDDDEIYCDFEVRKNK